MKQQRYRQIYFKKKPFSSCSFTALSMAWCYCFQAHRMVGAVAHGMAGCPLDSTGCGMKQAAPNRADGEGSAKGLVRTSELLFCFVFVFLNEFYCSK